MIVGGRRAKKEARIGDNKRKESNVGEEMFWLWRLWTHHL